jgi:trimeric autotransporter adhesin
MPRSARRSPLRVSALVLMTALAAVPAVADEIWVAPTSQTDVGGIGVASNVVWPVTPRSAVRLAWSVPNNLQTFQGAKLVLASEVALASTTVNVLVCAAANSQALAGNCSGAPVPHVVSTGANTLREVDISAALAPFVSAPGQRHLAVIAYTPTLTTTTHVVGLRFTYAPTPPTGVATLGANTFTGTQTATAFVGDGSGLTNLPAPSGVAGLGGNTFSGTQTAPAFVGDGAGVSNVNANTLDGLDSMAFAGVSHGHTVTQVTGAARLSGGNTLTGSQTIDAGNLDLDPSTATAGNLTKNGQPFLHNFGTQNAFLGLNAGNLSMTGSQNLGLGPLAMSSNTTGLFNVAAGAEALQFNTTGTANVAVGPRSLKSNTEGSGNIAIGFSALLNNATGLNNVAMGGGALATNIDGFRNTAVGAAALTNNTVGGNNVAVGGGTLLANTSGNLNTAIGPDALAGNTSGLNNVALGASAGASVTTESNNIFLGASVTGVGGESNAMYLGRVGTQTKAVIAGVRGTSVASGEMVVVDASGRLGSAPVPVGGGGDITGVAANTGLTGGGLSGDVGLALDTAYTDARYSSIVHGHDVAAISGAATLGANSFSGSQAITSGNLSLAASTPTGGNIVKGGQLFVHSTGVANTFVGGGAGSTATTGVGQNSAFGSSALAALTSGDSNTAVGASALGQNTEGNLNTAVGRNALRINTTGGGNTVAGAYAMNVNTSGDSNTAGGYFAMVSNTTGSQNTAIGQSALSSNTTASGSTAIGIGSLQSNTGPNNVAIGRQAGRDATSGSYNIYVGADVFGVAGESNAMYLGKFGTQTKTVIAGVRGTAVAGGEMVVVDANGRLGSASVPVGGGGDITGVAANTGLTGGGLSGDVGLALDTGYTDARYAGFSHGHDVSAVTGAARLSGGNTLIGTQTIDGGNVDLDTSSSTAGLITRNGLPFLHSFGTTNTFLGAAAGNFSMTGVRNTGIGDSTLMQVTTGFQNTAVGARSLMLNTTGSNNLAIGYWALPNNQTGGSNTAVGSTVLHENTSGSENTATGFQAMYMNTTGTQNVAYGGSALQANVSGSVNTAIGVGTLQQNTTAFQNTAVGAFAMSSTTVGGSNTAVGGYALQGNVTGGSNTALGFRAGETSTGNNNIFLGGLVDGIAGESNAMYLGRVGTQTKTVIAGVRGTAVTSGEMVVVDANGRFGSAAVPVGGGGDITSVAGGTGLTGGGTSGDVGLALDLSYTDARYAAFAHGHAVSAISGAATLGPNTFVATQTVDGGNLDLDASTATVGNITKNGTRFLHNFGTNNTFLGANSGSFAPTVLSMTAVGFNALSNATGSQSTAVGAFALANSTGSLNTGIGSAALLQSATGNANTGIGNAALRDNIGGSSNTALGHLAGFNSTGSDNIYLGAFVLGLAGESNTMYLGNRNPGTGPIINRTFMAGVRGSTTGINDGVPVVIDSNGQLGTISSSARYKEDIHDLGAASRRLFNLRPVTFRYTQPFTGGVKPVQFGLIAEEVAQVFPELAVLNADGQPETVKYQDLSVLLLNEVQRQQETIDRQARELEAERQRVDALERKLQLLLERVGGIN